MAAVTFSATKLHECVLGNLRVGVYSCALPTTFTAGGEALGTQLDTDGWSLVYGMLEPGNVAVTEADYQLGLIGTYDTTNLGYTASTVTLVAHQDAAGTTVFDEADGLDCSANTTCTIVVIGR